MIDLDGLPLEEEEEEEDDEDEYDDEGASDEDETEDGESEENSETTASGEEDEWGFGEKKSRFSKELIVGFLAITILCSVFGVVVFNNLQGDGDEVAEEESPEGELGKEGGGEDPFASGSEVRTASHTAPGEAEAFGESGGGREMGTFSEAETFGEGIGEQGEPEIEIGSNTAKPRLDPFGQPIGSTGGTPGFETETTPGIGETSTGIGETAIGETAIGETGTGPFGSETLGATGTETLLPLGSETGTGLTTSEGTTGLFEPEATTRIETGGSETISPFGPTEPTARVDEFGRPVDEFGRPIETAGPTAGETGSPFPAGGSTGTGDTSTGLAETTTGIGETTTPLLEETRPGIGETTSLFPEEPIRSETGTGSTGDRSTGDRSTGDGSTGLFETEPEGTGLGTTEPLIGETGSTGTPGFEPGGTGTTGTGTTGTGTTEGSLFPTETGTGSTGAFPGESTTGRSGVSELDTLDTPTGSELPTIRAQDDSPFGSAAAAATTITGGYPVQPGDSYWTISRKVYGTARYFRVLAEYNSKAIPDPAKMRPGMTVQTPIESVLRRMLLANSSASAGSAAAARPTGAPPVTPQQGVFFDEKNQPRYRVGKSDTLTTIAADHLGRWARWRQIYEMNRDQLDNPNKLQIGMVLKLPADATRSAMSRRDERIR